MTTYTYDLDCFSDLYKECNGFRPSEAYYASLREATPDQLQEEWDFLLARIDQVVSDQERMEAECLKRLQDELHQTTSANGVSVATAIRWMHDAYGTNGDPEYLDYKLGVKYGTIASLAA